jgi:hypothetical protein
MATAETYNFKNHMIGNTFKGAQIEVLVDGAALDLTGAKIKMQLKLEKKAGAAAIKTFDTEDGSIEILTGNKKFKIPKQIVDVPARNYYYDIEITTADLDVFTYIEGRWNMKQVITNG